jgi:hypothetical protein
MIPGHWPQDSALPHSDPGAPACLPDEWMRGDEAEQRETPEILRPSLDEDRPAAYKLFP